MATAGNSRENTRALAEAGKFTALTVVLSLFYFYFPLFTFLTLPICPVPIVLLTSRYGSKYGFLASFATGIILLPLVSVLPAVSLFLFISFFGVLMGLAIRKELSGLQIVSVGVVAGILSTLALVSIAYFAMGINFITEQVKIYENAIHMQTQVYSQLGVKEAEMKKLLEDLKNLVGMIPYLMPALITISACWSSVVCFFSSSLVMKRLKLKAPDFPRFKEFDLPWYFSWIFLLGMTGILFGRYLGRPFYFIGLNFFIVAVFLFFIQGLTVLSYHLKRLNFSSGLKVLLYGLALFAQILFLGISFLGLLDTWLNYRKLPRDSDKTFIDSAGKSNNNRNN